MKTSPSALLSIVSVSPQDLKPATYNPRQWDNFQAEQLKESLTRFGFVDPILVNGAKNRKNIVIGGHFRLKTALDLGFKEVPVVYLDIPDVEKEKELNLRLNRNTGSWDYDLLKNMDIDLLLDIGFDDIDLSGIWDEALGLESDGFDTQKEFAAITNPESKPGEVYQLGRHRLICGDSTDPKVLEKLLGTNKINMVYSDPPYNLSYDYRTGIPKNPRNAPRENQKSHRNPLQFSLYPFDALWGM